MASLKDTLTGIFDRLTGTGQTLPAPTDEARQQFLREAADMGAARLAGYSLYGRYYDGDHHTARLLDRARLFLQASGLPYTENFCETIVNVHVQHTHLAGFQVDGNDTASEWLNDEAWARNEMDAVEQTVHHEFYVKGDAFISVDFDAAKDLVCYRFNRPENCKPVYNEDGDLEYISKVWTTSRPAITNPDGHRIKRLNLYFPDRVEKWFTLANDEGQGSKAIWAPHLDATDYAETAAVDAETGETLTGPDGETLTTLAPSWPVWWTMDGTPTGEPIGIALIHFRHRAYGRDMGRSLLRNAIPQQDALVKQLIDLFDVMDQQGWAQRWATGVQSSDRLEVAIGEYLTAQSADAKFGSITAADVGPILEAIDATITRMAARSQTPLHLMQTGGNLPSGETLKTAYSSLVKSTEDVEVGLTTAWRKVQTTGARVQKAFGTTSPEIGEDHVIDVHWEDVEPRNEESEARTFLVHNELGVSKKTLVRKLGYDPDEEETQSAVEAEAGAKLFAPPPPNDGGGDPPPDGVDPANQPGNGPGH